MWFKTDALCHILYQRGSRTLNCIVWSTDWTLTTTQSAKPGYSVQRNNWNLVQNKLVETFHNWKHRQQKPSSKSDQLQRKCRLLLLLGSLLQAPVTHAPIQRSHKQIQLNNNYILDAVERRLQLWQWQRIKRPWRGCWELLEFLSKGQIGCWAVFYIKINQSMGRDLQLKWKEKQITSSRAVNRPNE